MKEEKEVHHMTMAKASEKDLSDLQEFFELLDEGAEYGLDDCQNFLVENYHLAAGWQRVLFGYRVLLSNACDPEIDHLAFKPEIVAALNNQSALTARVEELEKKTAWSESEVRNLIQMIYSEFAETESAMKTTATLRHIIEQEVERHPVKPVRIFKA